LIAMALLVPPATARQADRAIVLPGATGTEGVARLNGQTFFAADLVARFGSRLAMANAKFDTGFPPTATQFEVNVVRR
jgi:hypothetical protein